MFKSYNRRKVHVQKIEEKIRRKSQRRPTMLNKALDSFSQQTRLDRLAKQTTQQKIILIYPNTLATSTSPLRGPTNQIIDYRTSTPTIFGYTQVH